MGTPSKTKVLRRNGDKKNIQKKIITEHDSEGKIAQKKIKNLLLLFLVAGFHFLLFRSVTSLG